MPRIVRPGGRQHRVELATQRQTAKLTLSQLIHRLPPQRTQVRHRRSNRRRLVRPNNQITRALAPPSLPRPPSPTPHDLTPKLRATFPSFVTRYRAGDIPITSTYPNPINRRNTRIRARPAAHDTSPNPPPSNSPSNACWSAVSFGIDTNLHGDTRRIPDRPAPPSPPLPRPALALPLRSTHRHTPNRRTTYLPCHRIGFRDSRGFRDRFRDNVNGFRDRLRHGPHKPRDYLFASCLQ